MPRATFGQNVKVPTIGFLYGASADTSADVLATFQEGLAAASYNEGRNVNIEYRWAEGQPERLPTLAADLVVKGVAVIVAGPTVAALAAKSATNSIPLIFITSDDPVKLGLVASLNRPGANVTGVNFCNEIGTKRLDLLHELLPGAKQVGLILNPGSPPGAAALAGLQTAAEKFGYRVDVRQVQSERDVQSALAGPCGLEGRRRYRHP
jgi:putative ABC transport system substrate-binding protein